MKDGMESQTSNKPIGVDMLNLQLDKLTLSHLKSAEELRQHSIDPALEEQPIDKALHLVEVGDEIQKLSVVYSLADLYRQDQAGCTQRLLPKMQECLPIASSEFHLVTSVTIKSLMERKIIPVDTLIQTFLHTIMNGIEHPDPVVADAWVDCLVDIIPNIPLTVLRNQILPLAVSKSTLPRPVPSRTSSCRIIGALCKTLMEHFPNVDAKRDVMPTVLMLCQDVSPEVRAAMSLQLPSVVHLLGSENSKTFLLPAMVDLASDEVSNVKEATFTALVESIAFFSSDVIKTVVLPLLLQLINYALKYDNNVLLVIAAGFGKMVTGLERVIQSSEKESYLKSYALIIDRCNKLQTKQIHPRVPFKPGQLPGQGSSTNLLIGDSAVKCRQYCAYNFPAVAKFLINEKSKTPIETLHKIIQEFISDHSPLVRRSIAVSLHEVVTIYGKYRTLLRPDICVALHDNDEHVLDGFVPHLAFILVQLKELSYSQKEQNRQDSEILEALMSCEAFLGKTRNWRLHAKLIEQMEVLWYLFPTDTLYNNFIPNFFKKIYVHRALPIREALIRTILVTLKYTPKEIQRVDTINALHELAVSQSFYDRMLYIRTCSIVLQVFSTTFFKQNFLSRLLHMTDDPVANIRWGVCRLVPNIRRMLSPPADKEFLLELDTRMEALASDSDNEVLFMTNQARAEISSCENSDFFPDDNLRYDEEKAVFSLNPKLVQAFPASCSNLFHPSIHGQKLLRKVSLTESDTKGDLTDSHERVPVVIGAEREASSSGTQRRRSSGSRGQLNSDSEAGFTDKEFLVDAGVNLPLSPLSKYPPSENNNLSEGTRKDKEFFVAENGRNCEEIRQIDWKASPQKKQIFRHSIPVRKKSISTEQCLGKNGEEGNGRAQPAQPEQKENSRVRTNTLKKSSNVEVSLVDKRRSLDVTHPERRHTVQAKDPEKRHSLQVINSEKRRSLQVMDSEKGHSFEIVDINKNVTRERQDLDGTCTNSVQRRKKSQLPRPLSCVVLPVRSKGIEKPNSNSKLPIMRRS